MSSHETLTEKVRQAARKIAFQTNGDTAIGSQSRDAIADAVLKVTLQEVIRVAYSHHGECGRGCEAEYIKRALDALLAQCSQEVKPR
jgi:hypothetical protein